MERDAELIRRWRAGADAALATLLRRHERAVFGFLHRLLGDRHEAEDAAQETFLIVVRKLRGYRERGHFKSWLYRIAHREGLRALRRRRARDGTVERIACDPVERAGSARGPSEQLAREEEMARLEHAIGRLPALEREVVLLRVHQELPFKEIARVQGCPLNTALGRMHNATRRLRDLLGRERT